MHAARPALGLALLCLLARPLAAWEDHARLSRLALGSESWAGSKVRAESLEAFLGAERSGLAGLLSGFEARAAKELAYYPKLPAELAFRGEGEGPALRAAFLAAIRLNPDAKLILYLKPAPSAPRARPELPVDAVDPFDGRFENRPFESLAEGAELGALEVLATASDEPDYGLDCGLYEDNGTEAGSRYGLGEQPFGNPALDYGSQAPLHMAFAHEDPIIGLAAPFTRRSLADYRFRLYGELARFAFGTGHPYWGYRFGGWALHYVQDLCQPYHASLLPGLSAFRILALNAFGSAADREAALIFLSNRHSLVEDYAYRAVAAGQPEILAALGGSEEGKAGLPPRDAAYRSGWLYDAVARRAFGRGRRLDALLASSFPARYVSDPSYDYGLSNVGPTRDFDPYAALHAAGPEAAGALEGLLAACLADAGSFSRSYLAYLLDESAKPGPRRAPLDLRGPAYLAILLALAALLLRSRRRSYARRALREGGEL
ncbi:MAG TPA: phospholipase [Spirochaetia bacterium]|nr:phospholipase [Spirochaetia bacterium]